MADRLGLYNAALLVLGDTQLADLTEAREPRRLLDQVWNGGGVRYCLEQAQWHFAMRTSHFTYDPAIVPPFGFIRAVAKPDDWIITSGVFSDERCTTPLTQYADEVGYWFSDLDDIYVRYVSDDAAFGSDLSRWPATFLDYAAAYFASKIVHKFPGSGEKRTFLLGPEGREDRGWLNRCLLIAKNKAAMVLPATFPSRGTWAAARTGGLRRSVNRDGGSISNLIG